jgi:CDP-paratose 2-epimerase
LDINLTGTVNLLELAKRSRAGFILLSTSRVYSIKDLLSLKLDVKDNAFTLAKTQNLPTGVTAIGVSEDFATTAPISLYGATKLASELLALEYGLSFDFPVWIDRCGVLAGAGQFARADQGIFSFWINSHATKSPLKYIGFEGKGYQVRDAFHPRDLFTLIKTQIKDTDKSRERIFNAGGGATNAMSLKQLDDWCAERFGAHPVACDQSSRPFDIPWMILDSGKAKDTFGWQPQITLPEILDEMAEHAMAHPNWLKITST